MTETTPDPERDHGLRDVVLLAVVTKLAILGVIYLAWLFLPFNATNYAANFSYPDVPPDDFLVHLRTWDAQHYLFVAERGYAPLQNSNAFYPLLPGMIAASRFLFLGNSLVAGLVLSNLLAVVACALLYRIVRRRHDPQVAFLAVLLLLAFPTAFFGGLVYTESLFLVLSLALRDALDRDLVAPAAACALLLPLSRPTGILVLLPVVVGTFLSKELLSRSPRWRRWVVPLAFAAGVAVYLAVMRHATGSWLAGFEAQRAFISRNSAANVLHPIDWIRWNFFDVELSVHDMGTSVIDRIFFVGFLVAAALTYRRVGATFFAFVIAIGLVPALTGNLMSYPRYLGVVFPVCIALAVRLRQRALLLAIPGFALQSLFAALHSLNVWVS